MFGINKSNSLTTSSRTATYRTGKFIVHLSMFYISILLMLGYSFGSGDMVEALSLITYQINPDLFSSDLYIQSMTSELFNERYLYILTLGLFQNHIETWAIVFHAICSLVLFSGLYKIASLFLPSRFFRWISLYIMVVLLNQINIGGNELYYNFIVPSLPAKAAGAWSLYFFLREKYTRSALFIAISVIFQPLVAAQLLLLHLITLLVNVISGKMSWKKQNNWSFVFIIPVIGYLALLSQYHQAVDLSSSDYFNIIRLRMAHHFFPAHFGLVNYIIYAILTISALYYFYRQNRTLFWWILAIIDGCLIYIILIHLEIELALMTQWFKSTIWLEYLGVLSFVAMINERLMMRINMAYFFSGLLILLSLIIYMKWPPLDNKPYEFADSWMDTYEVEIAEAAGDLTTEDAVFIIPATNSTFRHVSKRSVFVDFKSISHNKAYLAEWAYRVNLVYGLDHHADRQVGFNSIPYAAQHYANLDAQDLVQLKKDFGVTHILTYIDHVLPFKTVARTAKYAIYEIKPTDEDFD